MVPALSPHRWILLVCILGLGGSCTAPGGPGDTALPGGLDLRPGAPVDLSPGGPQPSEGDALPVGAEDDLAPGVPRLRVTMVNVGQGDGLVIRLPGGRTVALDGGGFESGWYHDYLRTAGISRLDFVVLTHAHADHYTGLPAAIRLLPDDCRPRVFDPGYDRSAVSGYRAFREAAGCRYQALTEGASLSLDPAVEVTVISARTVPFSLDASDGINNTSVVLRMRYRNFSVLLAGDAEQPIERRILEQAAMRVRSTVAKLGHHGSCDATGTSYLHAVAPQLALISVGANNAYGHPHCQTLSRLRAASARWLRTDLNGTVSVVSDGVRYAVQYARGVESADICPRGCAVPVDF
jgi:competence protein ComEC